MSDQPKDPNDTATEPRLTLNVKRVRTHVRGGNLSFSQMSSAPYPTSSAPTSGSTISGGGSLSGSVIRGSFTF